MDPTLYGSVHYYMEVYIIIWKCTLIYGSVHYYMEVYIIIWKCTLLIYGSVRVYGSEY